MTDQTEQRLVLEVSGLRGDVRELTARVDAQLEHGSRKMDDHEARIRLLEQAKWKAAGAAAAAGTLAGGTTGALLAWLLAAHP